MLRVERREIELLRKVGLLQDKRTTTGQEANYTVLNRTHKSRVKTYAVVETIDVLKFFEFWDRCNLQEITKDQFKQLCDEERLGTGDIQYPQTYLPSAIAYVSSDGRYFVQKMAKLLIPLGIWRNKSKTHTF